MRALRAAIPVLFLVASTNVRYAEDQSGNVGRRVDALPDEELSLDGEPNSLRQALHGLEQLRFRLGRESLDSLTGSRRLAPSPR